MSLMSYLKNKAKVILSIAVLSAMTSQLLLPIASASASGPRFNFLEGDVDLLRGANITRNETEWRDPVSGNAGDEFRGIVYYHNGIVDTVAKNTRIKVNIPSQTANKSAVLTASISADNASTVMDTIVNGSVIGRSGLTVNLDQDATLEFVPGSVKWFPNKSKTPVALPAGSNGNDIVSGNGLNIGDINGCWEFAGYVTFGFKSVKKVIPKVPNIDIDKTVRNTSKSVKTFSEQVSAEANEEVEFKIVVTNTGEETLNNVTVNDVMPAELTYVIGSMKRINGSQTIDIAPPEVAQFFAGGLNIGSIDCVSKTVTIVFKAKTSSDIKVDKCIVNKAVVMSGKLTKDDIATVCLVPKVIVKKPILTIQKLVRNFTNNEKDFVDGNQASAGDVLEYEIVIKNTGSAPADQVRILDTIPANTEFITGTTTIARNEGDANTLTDGIAKEGIVIDAITAGETVTLRFRVKTSSKIADGICIVNVAKVVDDGKEMSDDAKTCIKVIVPEKPALPVTGSMTTIISLMATLLAGFAVSYYRYRKILGTKEAMVINSLLK